MKKIMAVLLALVMLFGFVGCGSAEKEEKKPEKTESQTDTTESETESKEDEGYSLMLFKKGVWEASKDGAVTGYYYFNQGMTECKYHDAEGKGGVAFDYEIQNNQFIFHMGSADNNTPADVKFKDEENCEIKWEDRTETLKYVSELTYEEFIANK